MKINMEDFNKQNRTYFFDTYVEFYFSVTDLENLFWFDYFIFD